MGKLTVMCVAALVRAVFATNELDLWNAAKLGDLDSVNTILARGTEPNWRNPDRTNETALHRASAQNNLAVVKALIAGGADIDALNESGRTPIKYAAFHGHLNIVKTLIAANANLGISTNNKGWGEGYTVLHIAARRNKPDVAKLLLEAGSDNRKQDIDGDTPGDVARKYGHPELASMIDNYIYIPVHTAPTTSAPSTRPSTNLTLHTASTTSASSIKPSTNQTLHTASTTSVPTIKPSTNLTLHTASTTSAPSITPETNLVLIITGVICGSAVFFFVIYLVVRCFLARHARDQPEQPCVKEYIRFVNTKVVEMEHDHNLSGCHFTQTIDKSWEPSKM